MSIAVMNWVWQHSPASGNERLVLLALADACGRDDGTGCWPSHATIARKANISRRTVQRVIGRLEADGHLLVHRGDGRHHSSNSYTIVLEPPRQSDACVKTTPVSPRGAGGASPGDVGGASLVTHKPPMNPSEPAEARAPAGASPSPGVALTPVSPVRPAIGPRASAQSRSGRKSTRDRRQDATDAMFDRALVRARRRQEGSP